ncbi:MAG: DUF262 domain-containing protein [Bacteroidota bacterium]
MNNYQSESLEEIANWQLDAENAKVGLPALQRGYVWKPKQVETLWDSLLRGFPIGSFLVSETDEQNTKKDLLDGQQRATAIAMGFYNPWEISNQPKFFSNKFKNIQETVPVLWLDIAVNDNQEIGDFLFLPRIVTQSHPWGFNRRSEVLGIANRRNANEKFIITGDKYPHYKLKDVFPWEAELPIPLIFLIDSIKVGKDNWIDRVIEKSEKHLSHIKLKHFENSDTYVSKLREALSNENFVERIINGIHTILNTKIPIIILTNKNITEESSSASEDASTLFMRINTTGTRLEGEELIYSMYKTVFPKSKELVEAAGAGFIAPSRITTIISRIVLTDISIRKKEFNFSNSPNLKQFKNALKDINGDFYKGMKEFAENPETLNSLFNVAKGILIGEKEFQLPVPLAIDIAKSNSDVLFILLYWIHSKNIEIEMLLEDESLHKKILGAITNLNWFVWDTNIFLNRLAEYELESGRLEFWNSKLFLTKGEENRWFSYLQKPEYVREILVNKINKGWEDVISDEIERTRFTEFFHSINGQRFMLLFAQRNYIKNQFGELQWDTMLEDINRPYDWDHIYPDNWWTYNIPNFSTVTAEWRWSIGNFRALALEVNRSQGDRKSPKSRLIDNRSESFITNNNWLLWEQMDEKISESQVEVLAKAIVNRLVDIYQEWYITLNIGEYYSNEIYDAVNES